MTYATVNYYLYSLECSGLIIYFIEIFLLISSKKESFRSAFFVIFISTGFSDLLYYTGCYFVRLRAIFDWQLWSSDLVSLGLVFYGGMFLSHFFGNTLIVINRYTAVCYPTLHQKFWRPKFTALSIFSRFFLSLLLQAPCIGMPMDWIDNGNGTYEFVGQRKDVEFVNRVSYAVVSASFSIVCVLLNLFTIKSWRLMARGTQMEIQQKHQERNLIFYCLATCFFSTLMCIVQCLRAYGEFTENWTMAKLMNNWSQWLMSVLVCANPLSLLLFSSDFRRECYARLGILSIDSSIVIYVPSTKTFENSADIKVHVEYASRVRPK